MNIKLVVVSGLLLLEILRRYGVWGWYSRHLPIPCRFRLSLQGWLLDFIQGNDFNGVRVVVAVVLLLDYFTYQPFLLFDAVAGLVIYLVGATLSSVGRITLGLSWADIEEVTDAPQPLVMTGVYAWCRNPIYTGLLICWLGFCVALGCLRLLDSWGVFGLMALITLAVDYHREIREEENFLSYRHGAAYLYYRNNVPTRYLPISGFIRLCHRVIAHLNNQVLHRHHAPKHI